MLNKKILLTAIILCCAGTSYAYTPVLLNDLTQPKEASYRVGISDVPENRYVEAQAQNQDEISQNIARVTSKDNNNIDTSYAELSIKNLSREISQELQFEEQDMVSDLTLLWQGAAMQSDTINFALYKLANPDADKPNKSTVKNMLKTIASMSTLVGSAMANPLLAGTSFITGDVLGIMSQDTKALNYKYTKVTDADMIILIRKVEDLQQTAVNLYYDYMTSKKQLEMATKLVQDRQKRFNLAQKNNVSKEMLVITDAYYRTALDKQRTARAEFLSKRATLEQFVGNEAFNQFEDELAKREYENKTANNDERKQQDEEYKQTIKNVEDYKSSLDLEQNNEATSTETASAEDEDAQPQAVSAGEEENTDDELLASKADKYSTKGLIFVHDNDRYKKESWEMTPEEQEEARLKAKEEQQSAKAASSEEPVKKSKRKSRRESKQEEVNATRQSTSSQQQQLLPVLPAAQQQVQKPKTYNGVELLPLDTIKTPERQFRKNGYSIFAE
jgi:hypothetical protein